MPDLKITPENLVKLLKLASTTIRDMDDDLVQLNKLARAMAVVEALDKKGLLNNTEGKTAYEKAQELSKKADEELETLEYMAQNSPQKYAGLGSVSETPSRGGNIISRIDRLVMGT
jgi:hypothetical protein